MIIAAQKVFEKVGTKKMEVNIIYTVPFYISRLLFLVGILRSFPYMKPVFHIHTAEVKKEVRILPILATTVFFEDFRLASFKRMFGGYANLILDR